MKKFTVLLLACILFCCKNPNPKTPGKPNQTDLADITSITNYLNDLEKKDSLHGSVLIADGNEILLKKAFGYQDLEHTKKHTIDGKLELASMPKMFTAIAIMQLASKGKLDINAPINAYLKDINTPSWKDRITVKNLLSHTSGLGFYWEYPSDELSSDLDTLYEVIKKRDTTPQELGAFNYSNNGYIVLGEIIQEVSGVSYKEYIQKHILTELGMNTTELGLPDGGYFKATVDDLWLFSKALRSYSLLDKNIQEEMITKASDVDYGLGFKLDFRAGSSIYGHTGGSWNDDGRGIASAMDIVNDRYTVIILTNRNPNLGGSKARGFMLDYFSSQKQ